MRKTFIVFRRDDDYAYGDGKSKLYALREQKSTLPQEALTQRLQARDGRGQTTFVRESGTPECQKLLDKVDVNFMKETEKVVRVIRHAA